VQYVKGRKQQELDRELKELIRQLDRDKMKDPTSNVIYTQLMAPLPESRTRNPRAFSGIAIDYGGPFITI
jgi:hypothetical protein